MNHQKANFDDSIAVHRLKQRLDREPEHSRFEAYPPIGLHVQVGGFCSTVPVRLVFLVVSNRHGFRYVLYVVEEMLSYCDRHMTIR